MNKVLDIHSCTLFNPTLESSNTVNFLDLSITRNPTHLNIGIYRKPTTTDTTIITGLIILSNTEWQPVTFSSAECSPSR